MMELISSIGFERIVIGVLGLTTFVSLFLGSRNKNKAAVATFVKDKLDIDNTELVKQLQRKDELHEENNRHNRALINRSWDDISRMRSEGKTTLTEITDALLREGSGKTEE